MLDVLAPLGFNILPLPSPLVLLSLLTSLPSRPSTSSPYFTSFKHSNSFTYPKYTVIMTTWLVPYEIQITAYNLPQFSTVCTVPKPDIMLLEHKISPLSFLFLEFATTITLKTPIGSLYSTDNNKKSRVSLFFKHNWLSCRKSISTTVTLPSTTLTVFTCHLPFIMPCTVIHNI